jgi:hypothetical protein
LSADQGFVRALYDYEICLRDDQGYTSAQSFYDTSVRNGELSGNQEHLQSQSHWDIITHSLRLSADAGCLESQLRSASLLRSSRIISHDCRKAAFYYKLAADQGSPEGQLMYAECLITGEGVELNSIEAEKYYLKAVSVEGCWRAHLRYAIALVSGQLGRFDFERASLEFSTAADFSPLAHLFANALSEPFCLDDATSVRESASVFGLLFEEIPLIRLLNPELCEFSISEDEVFDKWLFCYRSAIHSLLDLSQRESAILSTLPTDLMSCQSLFEMIPLIFKMYSIQSSLYGNVNQFLRSFPVDLIGKLLKELHGVMSYIYLLQSSIEQGCLRHPLMNRFVVYRGFSTDGIDHAQLYESMIGDVVVWRGFASTSLDRALVISSFVRSSQGVLFEIVLPPGAVAASIAGFSAFPNESEIMIAASSGFVVDSVDNISVLDENTTLEFTVPCVKLTYFVSWYDFDLDRRPPRLII